MGSGQGQQVIGGGRTATAPCFGTIVHLTRDVLVGRMGPLVHFVTIVRGGDREGSISTPGEPRVDSEERTACPGSPSAVSLRFG